MQEAIELSEGPGLIGKTVGNFRVEKLLGIGGMGRVYLLCHTRLPNTFAALKVLRQKAATTPYVKERFVQEALVAAAVGSHRVARPIDIGRFDDGSPYIILELASGRTLSQELSASGPMSVTAALRIAHRVADTMALVHARGIVHRDLKPSNVMLDGDLENPRVKLLDFGVARPPADLRLAQTVEHAIVGSPGFMSPEAATGGTIDARSDVFSLGATLYRSLASDVPFPHDQNISSLLLEGPPPIASKRPRLLDPIPPALEDLVERMLAKEPALRPMMAEVRDAIATIVEIPPELTESTTPLTAASMATEDVVASTITVGSGPAVDLPAIRAQLQEICEAKLPTVRVVEQRRVRWPWFIAALLAAAATSGVVVYALRSSDSQPERAVEVSLPPFASATAQQLTFDGVSGSPTVSLDGNRLAYASDDGQIVIRDLKTGRARAIHQTSNGVQTLLWSPNGRELLVNSVILNVDNGNVRRRVDGCSWAIWSPDGATVASRCSPDHDHSHWQFVDLATNTLREVKTPVPDAVWCLSFDWSSNGLLIALFSHERGVSLWTFRPDGTQLRRIYRDESVHLAHTVRWSADGTRIFMMRQRDRAPELIMFEHDPVIGAVREIGSVNPPGLAFDGWDYSITRDERKVFLTRAKVQFDLELVSGGKTVPLTSGTTEKRGFAVSPDGSQIAFASGSSSRVRIQIMPSRGGAPRSFGEVTGAIRDLAWSPDASELVYSRVDAGKIRLWRLTVATGESFELPVDNAGLDSGDVEWAPLREILYQSAGNRNYHLHDPITGKTRPLIADESVGWIFNAQISPDGQHVAVVWNRDPIGVWMLSLTNGKATHLFGEWLEPVGWSKDGTTVIVGDFRDRRTMLIGIDVRSRASRVIRATQSQATHGRVIDDDTFVLMNAKSSSDLWMISTDAASVPLPTEVEPIRVAAMPTHAKPTNLDMKSGVVGERPDAWVIATELRARLAIESNRRVLLLESDAPRSGVRGYVTQRIDATAYRGRRVRMRARMRVDTQSMGVLKVVSVIDGRANEGARVTAVNNPTDWAHHEVAFEVRPDAEQIELRLGAAGRVSFEDISLDLVK